MNDLIDSSLHSTDHSEHSHDQHLHASSFNSLELLQESTHFGKLTVGVADGLIIGGITEGVRRCKHDPGRLVFDVAAMAGAGAGIGALLAFEVPAVTLACTVGGAALGLGYLYDLGQRMGGDRDLRSAITAIDSGRGSRSLIDVLGQSERAFGKYGLELMLGGVALPAERLGSRLAGSALAALNQRSAIARALATSGALDDNLSRAVKPSTTESVPVFFNKSKEQYALTEKKELITRYSDGFANHVTYNGKERTLKFRPTYDNKILYFEPCSDVIYKLRSLLRSPERSRAEAAPVQLAQDVLHDRDLTMYLETFCPDYSPLACSDKYLELGNEEKTIRISHKLYPPDRDPREHVSSFLRSPQERLTIGNFMVETLPEHTRLANGEDTTGYLTRLAECRWKIRRTKPQEFGRLNNGKIVALDPDNLVQMSPKEFDAYMDQRVAGVHARTIYGSNPADQLGRITNRYFRCNLALKWGAIVENNANYELAKQIYKEVLKEGDRYPHLASRAVRRLDRICRSSNSWGEI